MKIYWLLILFVGFTAAANQSEKPIPSAISWKERILKAATFSAALAAKMHQDLQDSSIPSYELVAAVKSNPRQFFQVVPHHTRKRIIAILPEHDQTISAAIIAQYKSDGQLYDDIAAEKRVMQIVEKIATILPKKNPVKIYLLKDNVINAYCLPDGTIFVTRGALKELSDKKMAAVLAHEFGHAAARHGAENFTKMLLQSVGRVVYADAKTAESFSKNQNTKGLLIQAGYGLGSRIGFILPFSRIMEYEADKLGAIFLKEAGLDPLWLVDLLEMFDKQAEDLKWYEEFLSTHPVDKKRIAKLKTVIAEMTN